MLNFVSVYQINPYFGNFIPKIRIVSSAEFEKCSTMCQFFFIISSTFGETKLFQFTEGISDLEDNAVALLDEIASLYKRFFTFVEEITCLLAFTGRKPKIF